MPPPRTIAADDPSSSCPSLFDRSTRAEPTAPGRYAASVEPGWNGPAAPNGGILAATMVRAAQAELGPGAPPPRTIAAHYLEAPAAGEVELEVEVLRRGKRVSACDVRMHQSQRLVAQATILSSAVRSAPLTLAAPAPRAPDPEDVPTLARQAFAGAPPVFEQLVLRPTFGETIYGRGTEALSGGWMALREDGAPLDAARLCALCDLWWPALFVMLDEPVPVPTLQLTVHLRTSAPARGPVLARFVTRHLAEGHLEESGELWSQDGELLAESRQLALVVEPPRAAASAGR